MLQSALSVSHTLRRKSIHCPKGSFSHFFVEIILKQFVVLNKISIRVSSMIFFPMDLVIQNESCLLLF